MQTVAPRAVAWSPHHGTDAVRGKDPEPLMQLPPDVMRSILQRLLPADRAALRGSSKAARDAVNARVAVLVLYERDLEAAASKMRAAPTFPEIKEARITLDGSSNSQSDDEEDGPPGGGSSMWRPAPAPAAQLPGRFAGSCTLGAGGRRSQAWGVIEMRAAAVLERCTPRVRGLRGWPWVLDCGRTGWWGGRDGW